MMMTSIIRTVVVRRKGISNINQVVTWDQHFGYKYNFDRKKSF